MSKNILILSGSPRKGGNSDILCDRFMEGARESGHRAEKVFLRDKNIGYCIGCEACHQNNGVCVQKDDMAGILEKMIAADVIVMATPVYFYTMDAQMKTLIVGASPGIRKSATRRFTLSPPPPTAKSGRWRGPSKGSAGSCTVWKARGKRASFTDRAHGKKATSRKARL